MNLSINLEQSRAVPAPRTVFLRYPHGAPFGAPGDRAGHMAVLLEAFRTLYAASEPGLITDPGFRWRRTEWPETGPSAFLEDPLLSRPSERSR